MQAAQVDAFGVAGRGNRTRRQALDVELRKSPRDVGTKPWPVGGGRRTQQLHGRGKLRVTAKPLVVKKASAAAMSANFFSSTRWASRNFFVLSSRYTAVVLLT